MCVCMSKRNDDRDGGCGGGMARMGGLLKVCVSVNVCTCLNLVVAGLAA